MFEPAERDFFTVSLEEIIVPEGRKANPAVVKTLAKSIERIGLINPLTVVAREHEKYELIAGMNRLEACKKIGLQWAWVVVLGEGDPVHEVEFDENLARAHFSPEQLAEYRKWAKEELARRVGTGESARKVAKELGVSRSRSDRTRTAGGSPEPPAAQRVGADGKHYPATKPGPAEKSERAERARGLQASGKTVAEIASELGVSERTVASDLAEDTTPTTEAAGNDGNQPTITVEVPSAAELIVAIRDEEGLHMSRETLARLIGTTPDIVAAWESEEQTPSGPELTLLHVFSDKDLLDSWIHDAVVKALPLPEDVSARKLTAWIRERVEGVKLGDLHFEIRQKESATTSEVSSP